jgi:hypothetical protein
LLAGGEKLKTFHLPYNVPGGCEHKRYTLTPEGLYVCLDCGEVLGEDPLLERYRDSPRYTVKTPKRVIDERIMQRWNIYIKYKNMDSSLCATAAALAARSEREFEELYWRCYRKKQMLASRLSSELGIEPSSAMEIVERSKGRIGLMVKLLRSELGYKNLGAIAKIVREVYGLLSE